MPQTYQYELVLDFKLKGSGDIWTNLENVRKASSHQGAESTLRLVGSEGLEEAEDLKQRLPQLRVVLF